MEIAAIVLAAVAIILALRRGAGGASKQDIDDVRRDARRDAENLAEEVRRELETTRRLLAEVAAGAKLDREQIIEGRLWRDIDGREALSIVAGGGVRWLDVRSPGETSGGVIVGAQLIPIEQLENRLDEVPRDGGRMIVYCAAGGRSAAACELMASRGFAGLLNLSGGIGAWSGAVERPSART